MVIAVHNRPDRSRYEIEVDGQLAGFADYRDDGKRVVFPHTEIDEAHRGDGLGEQLVAGALDDVRARGLRAVPLCWFVEEFFETHPEYRDLIAA